MDNLQRSELDALNRVADFRTKYSIVLNTITEFAPESLKFDNALSFIKDAGVSQKKQEIDQSVSLSVKKAMANIITKYCLRAGVLARSANNIQLANLISGSAASIYNANKTEALHLAKIKRDALKNNGAIFTNITDAIITEIDNAISSYDNIKDAPTETRQTIKSTATDQLPLHFTKAHDAVESMYDLVYSYFLETKPEMVHEFEIAKQVITTGTHSTSITFDCLADEDGTLIHSFTVNDRNKNKVFLSDEDGLVNIEHHRTGKFHFTIASATRIDVDFVTTIKRGTNNHFTIRLKK